MVVVQHIAEFVSVTPAIVQTIKRCIGIVDFWARSIQFQTIVRRKKASIGPFARFHVLEIQLCHWLEPSKIRIELKRICYWNVFLSLNQRISTKGRKGQDEGYRQLPYRHRFSTVLLEVV